MCIFGTEPSSVILKYTVNICFKNKIEGLNIKIVICQFYTTISIAKYAFLPGSAVCFYVSFHSKCESLPQKVPREGLCCLKDLRKHMKYKSTYSPSHIVQIMDFFFNFSMNTARENLKLSQSLI